MTSIVKNHGNTVKSAGDDINSREAKLAHERSFGDLFEKASEAAGLPGDQVPYWDPMGFLGRKPVNAKSKMFEKWEDTFRQFNDYVAQGAPVREAAKQAKEDTVSKSLSTSNYSMPIFFTPDVFVQDTQDTPLADMLPRVAVQEDTIKVDELTSVGDASQFSEGASNWPENDDSYSNRSYDVVSYGRENEVTDFVQLAARGLRSTRALTEEQQVRAIRQYEEGQLIEGKGNVDTDLSGNDSNGYESLTDLANSSGTTVSKSGNKMTISDVRDAIRDLRRNGAARDDIVHVTDHKTFQDLQEDTDDFTRYESPDDTLSFGFSTLEIDNTMVMESHGSPNTSSERLFTSFDASAHYMAMLQDVTMHPLAKTSPSETFATDAYGVLVSESPTRIHAFHNCA